MILANEHIVQFHTHARALDDLPSWGEEEGAGYDFPWQIHGEEVPF